MDLITSAIVAAIEHGAPDMATPDIRYRYEQLKAAIQDRATDAQAILAAIKALEADPASAPQRLLLQQQLSTANAAGDMALLFAAQELRHQIDLVVQPAARGAAPVQAPSPAMTNEADYATVKVFFATDRKLDASQPVDRRFGGLRGAAVSYGSCDISIPRDHRMGQLESKSLWRLEFRNDPAKHVLLLASTVQDQDDFFATLSAQLQAASQQSALLFVHGYNVSFEDAARRTGQISYDLGFGGVPLFYSWPSQGDVAAYIVDEGNIEWSQPHMTAFLSDVLSKTDAQNVYLIAHSMGNRGMTRAIAALVEQQPALAQRLTEIILAAPDIDAEVFKRDIAPALTRHQNPVTLYASSEDMALAAAKKVYGYPRAGDSGSGMVIIDGIETVDATGVDTSFMKHAYFAEKYSALSDIFYLIKDNKRADQRLLQRIDVAAGHYWTFKK
ncbi:alpha/beta hydrolase [Janthinobacterium agaricidamnosum]|uniref:Esterase/lipase superfamily enzyme n=1 Tax=Janthinobacterium agaricidamnosum NBRC 102515 = DSM 9628 TaxID=1349767 RepID=W0V7J6_9BURK|nr:alpha/beta hydrolase [Janthinobacterium agaricidamnosum]CDG83242.1 conserved hypothetical protein [Janthinobacterium agaricidamnosum NBRC 102515 = DSM 9628]